MGLFRTAGRVAVASHVHGQVQHRQRQRWAAQDAARPAPPPSQPQPAQSAAAVAPTTDDMLTRLAKLGELRAAGVLTEAEFEIQKARILAQ